MKNSTAWQVRLVLVALLVLQGISAAQAQQDANESSKPTQRETKASRVPDGVALNLLIRTTVIALNQANQTGNYTVMRDLAAPDFQRMNSPARLAEIFGPLRKRNLDLAPVLFYDPKLIQPPAINTNGRLRLSGFFNTRPEQVIFDLVYQRVGGRWLLFGISLEARPAPTARAGTLPGKKADKALAKKLGKTGGKSKQKVKRKK